MSLYLLRYALTEATEGLHKVRNEVKRPQETSEKKGLKKKEITLTGPYSEFSLQQNNQLVCYLLLFKLIYYVISGANGRTGKKIILLDMLRSNLISYQIIQILLAIFFLRLHRHLRHSQRTHTHPYERTSAKPTSMSIFED